MSRRVAVVAPDPAAGGIGRYAEALRTRVEGEVTTTCHSIPSERSVVQYVRVALDCLRGDAVHLHFEYGLFRPKLLFAWPFFVVLLLGRLFRGTPVYTTVHEVWTPETVGTLQYGYVWLIHSLVALASTELIFMTEHAREDFRALSVGSARIVPHGVPRSDRRAYSRDEARRAFGYDDDDIVVAQIGYVSERKGTDRFLDLAERFDEHEFLVAGGALRDEDEPYERWVRSTAGDNVQVTGVLPDERFHKAFIAADVAVLAYRDIRQSGIMNWCFAYGVPVVCSPIDRFVELEAACTGVAVFEHPDQPDPDSLDGALFGAVRARAERSEAMIEYGRENSMDEVASAYTALFFDGSSRPITSLI